MRRLHLHARSIAIGGLTCRKRAFGVSAGVLNANSDADSNRSQSQSRDQSQSVDLGKDDSRSRETVNDEQAKQGGHGDILEKLSRSLRSQRDPSRNHANSSCTTEEHTDAKTTSSSFNLPPLIQEITQKIDSAVEETINSCIRNPQHVIPPAGVSKRRKKEKQPRKKKASGKGGAGVRPAVESARASLAGFDAKRAGVLQLLLEGSGETNRLAKDGWTTGWGEDALRPGENENYGLQGSFSGDGRQSGIKSPGRGQPPHIRHPLPYTRRVEGLFDDARDLDAASSSGPGSINNILEDIDPPSEHKPIARLAHGLDRVLFNPGVHWLQDPRSRVYNFTPWLERIPKVTDFAFERVTGFIRSSQDDDLHTLAKIHSRPYVGSTSSLTGLLSHIYFLISGGKEVDTSVLSGAFAHEPTNFTPGQRMPVSIVLRYKDGVWAVDSGKDGDDDSEKNVLTWMGTLLEKFLTVPEPEFKTLLRSSPAPAEGEEDKRREAYRYAKSNRFLMRSQLDCVDPRLPGTGVFDVKTRAAVPIRLDLLNFEENSGYLIRTLHGPLESFEKEYYDLIRSAFLKYSFQARIGNMDGVFVAYHNTARVFGFQYVSLEEMDARLFGQDVKPAGVVNGDSAPTRGARIFEKCVKVLEMVMDEIVGVFGERSVKCTFETRERSPKMNIWVEPVEWDAEKEGKGKNLVEMKEAEEETKVAEQGKDGEEEENRVKTGEPPIVQIDVEVQNFVAGQPVRGSRAIDVAPDENWILHWTISHSSLEASRIRANLASAKDRQFRAWNFPANISRPEEMEAWWNALDFGKRQNAASPSDEGEEVAAGKPHDAVAGDESPVVMLEENSLIEEEGPEANENGAPPFNPRLFRPASTNIEALRQLSRDGREETLRTEAEEEAMGREKINGGVANSETKEVPEDGSSASTVTQASEMGTVDAVAQTSEEKK
ncbi:mitochondrial protein Pet127-domain-containing protein [Suillus subalutaceus]|uniref:mitochondrial protein Pet127-domain-containing protein n=1 Tax=Suillus subalutaceus TaxID=48586 RepID=UPI001B881DA9|nr:mitochondrial protein Pet127-domain-containing protein [Suillus subalutaceus]KAG1837781.1 mitochondrial protein Pet127-domain-containing protein [Suillus subalutaceus]